MVGFCFVGACNSIKYYVYFCNQIANNGGEEGKDMFDEQIIYRSSLQNFLIETDEGIILIDTGFKTGMSVPARKLGAPLYMGDKVDDYMAKVYISPEDADAMKLEGDNIIRVSYKDGRYQNFPACEEIAPGLYFIETKGHTKGNSIVILEHDGLYYMFHGDITYCDATLKANKLSIVFEDKAAARETLDRVRTFIKNNPTVYLSTHCPEVYENLEMKRVMKL